MRHFIQQKDQCLAYSAGMVMDIEPDVLMEEMGHDGQEIWWPEFSDARKYRGHTMQEVMDVALGFNMGFLLIEAYPMQAPTGAMPRVTFENHENRFLAWLIKNRAIIVGKLFGSELGHAVAWDGEKVYDPNDSIKTLHDFSIKEAWILIYF